MSYTPISVTTLRLLEIATVKLTIKRTNPLEREWAKIVAQWFLAQQNAFIRSLARNRSLLREADEIAPVSLEELFDQAVSQVDSEYAITFANQAEKTFMAGVAAAMKDYSLAISFTVDHPLALSYLANYGSQLITRVNQTTKDRINTIVTDGLKNGHSYTKIERAIIAEYRSFRNPPRYGPSHIQTRAQLVAVTETGNAYQSGNYGAVSASTATGLKFEKIWLTVGDKRVSEGCKTNAGEDWIPLDTPHISGDLHPLRFPGCRCVEGYRAAK